MLTYRYPAPVRLSRALNRLFDESFVYAPGAPGAYAPRRLALDVHADGDTFVITAAVPGLAGEDLSLEVLGDTVTLRGKLPETEAPEGAAWVLRERRGGAFERSLVLPAELDAAGAEASLDNGLLTVRLPKAEAARRKTIAVKAR